MKFLKNLKMIYVSAPVEHMSATKKALCLRFVCRPIVFARLRDECNPLKELPPIFWRSLALDFDVARK